VFHSDGILWPADGLQAGQGSLELYLHDVLPEPLLLPGQLRIIDDDLGSAEPLADLCRVLGREYPQVRKIAALSWNFDDAEVRDALTRQVFRHHRRSLARRQSTNTAPPSS
jgi:hypothetical protein